MNNLAPLKNCPRVQGKLIWIRGYNLSTKYLVMCKIYTDVDGFTDYTSLTSSSTKYIVMCKIYTDVDGIKQLYHDGPSLRKIIHSLKLVDYLHVQADNPWYDCFSTYRHTPIRVTI